MNLSLLALSLILHHEGFRGRPYWPGGDSGVTLDFGYDLAHHSPNELWSDWAGHLKPDQLKRLRSVVGLRGEAARATIMGLKDIAVTGLAAKAVFERSSAPKYWALASGAFPGIERLPEDAQGALFSLVYNRGPGMVDRPGQDNRREMREIRRLVPTGDLKAIAAQIRSMKRLWMGKRLPGLVQRREDEAALLESAGGCCAS